MKKQSLIFPCLAIILLLSCKKDPEPERTTYFMDEEFVDYSIFKKGSWWIYERDTLTTDSVYVIKSELSLVSPDSADYSWQRSEMQFGSSFNNDTVTSLGDFVKSTLTFYSIQKSSTMPASEALDFFSLKPSGYVLDLSPSLKMVYDTTTDAVVDSIPYTNVKIFHNLVTPSNPKLPKELWYAKNVGIVKKELFNGEVWTLVKYNAVQ